MSENNNVIIAAIIIAVAIVMVGLITKPSNYRYQWIGFDRRNKERVFDQKTGMIYTSDNPNNFVEDLVNGVVRQRVTNCILDDEVVVEVDDDENASTNTVSPKKK